MKTFALISLGCPRNLVDSEVIAGSLEKEGFRMVDVARGADVCVVNTCSFVESARTESVDALIEAADLKKKGKIRYLVVAGCLPQYYRNNLSKELPEADLVIGTSDIPRLASLVGALRSAPGRSRISKRLDYLYDEHSPRERLTPKHFAYVKIAEGCSNRCSYCVIPRLRGTLRSRTIASVAAEVRALCAHGAVKEINLIGQDTTSFGIDRSGKPVLTRLLRELTALAKVPRWIRLLYTHPAHYTDELIETIAREEKICNYLDLPLQHISDRILKKMDRKAGRSGIIKLIGRLRKRIPGLTLRTSIIVGFPGESERDFRQLIDFVRETRFERLGAFIYSREERTPAAAFPGQIPEEVKRERFDELMKLQQGISRDICASAIGKTFDVLIDEKDTAREGSYIGRTAADAPEIDGVVYVTGKHVKVGEFYRVRITDALEYDLVGEKV